MRFKTFPSRIFLYLILSAITAGLFSCSDSDKDDDDKPLSSNDLEQLYGYFKGSLPNRDNLTIALNPNGVCSVAFDTSEDEGNFYNLEKGAWHYNKSDKTLILDCWDTYMTFNLSDKPTEYGFYCWYEEESVMVGFIRLQLNEVPESMIRFNTEDSTPDDPDTPDDPSGRPVAQKFAKGDGTSNNPYQISTAAEYRKLVYDSKQGMSYHHEYFILTKDIRLNNKVIEDDGSLIEDENSLEELSMMIFKGTFDGQGHTISGLFLEKGLVYNLENAGSVKNLRIKDSYSKTNLFGNTTSDNPLEKLENIINHGTINGYFADHVTDIINCGNYGRITWGKAPFAHYAYGKVLNCYNYGPIGKKAPARNRLNNGIVLFCLGDISNCVNFGEVLGDEACGIVRCIDTGTHITSTIDNCVNYGKLSDLSDKYSAAIAWASSLYNKTKTICGNNYYLETSCTQAFHDPSYFKSMGEVLKMTPREMASTEFLEKLNANAANIPGACRWKKGADGYPTLEIVR